MCVRMMLTLCAYRGLNYFGFQKQPDRPTIQGVIQKALKQLHLSTNFKFMSRTDRGVSAVRQVLLFKHNLLKRDVIIKLNEELADVKLYALASIDEFSFKRDILYKEYLYVAPLFGDIDEDLLEKITYYVNDRHHNYYFLVKRPSLLEKKELFLKLYVRYEIENGYLIFFVRGKTFYWELVRRLINLMVSVSRRIVTLETAMKILSGKEPRAGIPPAPSIGLVLWNVLFRRRIRFEYVEDEDRIRNWILMEILQHLAINDWVFPARQ